MTQTLPKRRCSLQPPASRLQSAVRYAIYTRKSSDEGLTQHFNTTHSMGRLTLNILEALLSDFRRPDGQTLAEAVEQAEAQAEKPAIVIRGGNVCRFALARFVSAWHVRERTFR